MQCNLRNKSLLKCLWIAFHKPSRSLILGVYLCIRKLPVRNLYKKKARGGHARKCHQDNQESHDLCPSSYQTLISTTAFVVWRLDLYHERLLLWKNFNIQIFWSFCGSVSTPTLLFQSFLYCQSTECRSKNCEWKILAKAAARASSSTVHAWEVTGNHGTNVSFSQWQLGCLWSFHETEPRWRTTVLRISSSTHFPGDRLWCHCR